MQQTGYINHQPYHIASYKRLINTLNILSRHSERGYIEPSCLQEAITGVVAGPGEEEEGLEPTKEQPVARPEATPPLL